MHPTSIHHVTSKPDVCGGAPCVAGTRIRVQDIHVWHELQGLSVDEIVSGYPQLTMASVYGALSYYWDNKDLIEGQMREESEFVEQMKQKYPSPLKKKLTRMNGANDQVSSG